MHKHLQRIYLRVGPLQQGLEAMASGQGVRDARKSRGAIEFKQFTGETGYFRPDSRQATLRVAPRRCPRDSPTVC